MPHPFLPKPTWTEILLFASGVAALALLIRTAARLQKSPKVPPLCEPPGQRRGDFRVPVAVPVWTQLHGTKITMEGTLTDLSAGGATVTAPRAAPSGTRLTLTFVAGSEAFEHLPAELVRSESTGSQHALHCRFTALTPEVEQRLLRAVAAREREMARTS